MQDNNENNESNGAKSVPSDLVLDLNFVPDWARKPPGGNYFEHDKPRPRHGHGKSGPSDRRPRSRPAGDRKSVRRPPRQHEGRAAVPRRPERIVREPVERPPVNIRFIPRHRFLSEVLRRIKLSGRTYPLMEPAHLFVSNPVSCDVRIEVEKGASGVYLYQCRQCGTVSFDENTISSHAFKEHHAEYFLAEETEVEPPSGKFTCIAQCGLSGQLLAPPNHHSYQEKIIEIHRARYPGMSLEEYTSRIRTLHDEESIERWKTENTKKTVYRPVGDKDAESMNWAQASAYFEDKLAGKVFRKSKRAVLPVPTARQILDSALLSAVGDAWRRECRFPASVMAALRGAFHNKNLYLFRASKGVTFVSPTKPVPLLPEQAIESIGDVIRFLRDNPGCSRDKMLESLRPGCEKGSEQAAELLSPLSWLIERGHIIEFFDGTLSVPLTPQAS